MLTPDSGTRVALNRPDRLQTVTGCDEKNCVKMAFLLVAVTLTLGAVT